MTGLEKLMYSLRDRTYMYDKPLDLSKSRLLKNILDFNIRQPYYEKERDRLNELNKIRIGKNLPCPICKEEIPWYMRGHQITDDDLLDFCSIKCMEEYVETTNNSALCYINGCKEFFVIFKEKDEHGDLCLMYKEYNNNIFNVENVNFITKKIESTVIRKITKKE